jgi:hypothetical protein
MVSPVKSFEGAGMSILGSLKQLVGGGVAEESFPSSRLHVIDATRFNGGRERPSPRDQLALLNQLAAFAGREQVQMVVILAGRPLREVGDGEEYKGLQVWFAEAPDQLAGVVLKQARRGSQALVVTQDREVESEVQAAGLETMRVTTFRKALDEGGSGSGSRGGRRRTRSRRVGSGRSGGGRNGESRGESRGESGNQEQKATPPKPEGKGGVSDLIDLV